MNRLAETTRPTTAGKEHDRAIAAALLADRDDFVIDLREAGRTRSYLRNHEAAVAQHSTSLRATRRTLDIATAGLALVIASPLFLIVGLASKLSSRGPVFFVQERVGRNGKIFRCYKFRSMRPDADKRLKQLLQTDIEFREAWMQDQKVNKDPRITSMGRFLRKTSLDEIPQLINVLKGDMSIIGPRPVVPEETVRYGDAMATVLSVRPGITGLWQVSGRNNLSYPERVALDLRYVDEQSLRLDSRVLVKTVFSVATGKGAG